MSARIIKVGARPSRLSTLQARQVIDALRRELRESEIIFVPISTPGDRDQKSDPSQLEGGAFVKDIDEALLTGAIDVAVHSLKDLPSVVAKGLRISYASKRANPLDALVCDGGFDPAKPVGTSSPRRIVQIKALYPAADVRPMRGNVPTRIEKVKNGEYGSAVLAMAGIERLSLEGEVTRVMTVREMIPCAGQGIVAACTREDDGLAEIMLEISDRDSWIAASAERAFMATLGGGCEKAAGVFADVHGQSMTIHGMYSNGEPASIARGERTCDPVRAVAEAQLLAVKLLIASEEG